MLTCKNDSGQQLVQKDLSVTVGFTDGVPWILWFWRG
jgi:hypothetical protein